MPKRTDIKKILLIGSGPIVIGQACEFDYSGTQACRVLMEEGYEVVLVNSNPATIMTDPNTASRTYIEPLTVPSVAWIIEKERPQAILPTMGGQTALNIAMKLAEQGILEKFGVELIGASREAIAKAEDRTLFKAAMQKIGLELPRSGFAHSWEEAQAVHGELSTFDSCPDGVFFPVVIRPSFTLGGAGGGIAFTLEEFETIAKSGLDASPTTEILVEESILGWKEFEMEVVRDRVDNTIIICSIENFDPMGVHTGDSITVAPAQTLTDKEYQILRDQSIAVLREIGVDTGGSNVQFAIHPDTGRVVIIEMNPRVSRSSALASKATGFPIAKVAAKLAVGYTLPEIMNDITGVTPASFEPSIDYVVTKIPRFTFEKFPQAKPLLTTQMKSVGEAMAIGRTFKESLQKALRSMETGLDGLDEILPAGLTDHGQVVRLLHEKLTKPGPDRILYVAEALRLKTMTSMKMGTGRIPEEEELTSIEWVNRYSYIDPWFLDQMAQILESEEELKGFSLDDLTPGHLRELKKEGFSDRRLAKLLATDPAQIAALRRQWDIFPVFKRVDTCAAEFASQTAYLYSTYDAECEAAPSDRRKIMILGGGPNRIGQGIEFDYCCVHASFALREMGVESIMVNCNPETVSTDYDTSDRLYFEPLTFEDVMAIVEVEKPDGVIVQFGGQTPLKLAKALEAAGVPIIGTTPDAIDVAEDRERFQRLIQDLGLRQPPNGIARSVAESLEVAAQIGYPVVVRPSYVLGGRAMEVVYDQTDLMRYMTTAVKASPDHPILIDHFLRDAIEVDVDCLADSETAIIGGIMEHIEEAGVHSGDSACSLPPFSLSTELVTEIERQTLLLAKALKVNGLMNIQFAIQDRQVVYILEVNPRASRTVPFVAKTSGLAMAKVAAKIMAGQTLREQGISQQPPPRHMAVKEAVFPFEKFPGVDTVLGPEMKSTGEVMGLADSFGMAFAKAQFGAGTLLPLARDLGPEQMVFLSIKDDDKSQMLESARKLVAMGFRLCATCGTADFLRQHQVTVTVVNKVVDQAKPNCVDRMLAGQIALVFNTAQSKQAIADSFAIRRTALMNRIPYFTTVAGMKAAVDAIAALEKQGFQGKALQDYHRDNTLPV